MRLDAPNPLLPSHVPLVPLLPAVAGHAPADRSSGAGSASGLTAVPSQKTSSVRTGKLPAPDALVEAYVPTANARATGATQALSETFRALVDRLINQNGIAFDGLARDLVDVDPNSPIDDADLQRKTLLRSLVKAGRMPAAQQVALMHHAIAGGADLPLVRQLHEQVGLPVATLPPAQAPSLPPFEKLPVSPFEAAAAAGRVDVVDYLHARLDDFFAGREKPAAGFMRRLLTPPVSPGELLANAAGQAAAHGHAAVVARLAQIEGAADPAQSKVGAEAIMRAAHAGRTDTAQALIAQGFRPQDQPVLQIAAAMGDVELVRQLLDIDEASRAQNRTQAASFTRELQLRVPEPDRKKDLQVIIDAIENHRDKHPKSTLGNVARYLGGMKF